MTDKSLRQGRNEGGKGATIPRAPNRYGGAESLRERQKSQQYHKCFLQYSIFASERPQVRTLVRQSCFLTRAPSNLVTPLHFALNLLSWVCLNIILINKPHCLIFVLLTLHAKLTLTKVLFHLRLNLTQPYQTSGSWAFLSLRFRWKFICLHVFRWKLHDATFYKWPSPGVGVENNFLLLTFLPDTRDRVYGGTGGTCPPNFWTGGHNIFCPPIFCNKK